MKLPLALCVFVCYVGAAVAAVVDVGSAYGEEGEEESDRHQHDYANVI